MNDDNVISTVLRQKIAGRAAVQIKQILTRLFSLCPSQSSTRAGVIPAKPDLDGELPIPVIVCAGVTDMSDIHPGAEKPHISESNIRIAK
jgi:hypothetical protein